jgi:drug/metabolite transporter (DMT)-like permease
MSNSEIFEVCATIFVVGLFMLFILTVMKQIFEHRLKNKILDKGMSENIATSILSTHGNENKNTNIKWFAILAGLGIGLTGVNYTQPLGFHSLAIMAFSVSLSFLGYYFFTRNAGK